jgi:outer membrane immunogenic protein
LKIRLLSSVAVGVIATVCGGEVPALAQTPAVRNWAGFYLGLNAGGAWGRSSASTSPDCSQTSSPPGYICIANGNGAGDAAALIAAGIGTMNGSGFTGGVQVGYNWQHNNFVAGLEADFGAFILKGSRQVSGTYVNSFDFNPGDPFTVSSSFDTDWLLTLRARVGAAITPQLLAYFTGGLALTELTVGNSYFDTNTTSMPALHATENSSTSKLKVGWVIGGGLEWALNNHWSVRGEYLYLDFGKVTTTGTISDNLGIGYAQGLSTTADLTAQVARVGFNYKF